MMVLGCWFLFVVCCLLVGACRSLVVLLCVGCVCCFLCNVCCLLVAVCCVLCVPCRLSCVVCQLLCVVCYLLFVSLCVVGCFCVLFNV